MKLAENWLILSSSLLRDPETYTEFTYAEKYVFPWMCIY